MPSKQSSSTAVARTTGFVAAFCTLYGLGCGVDASSQSDIVPEREEVLGMTTQALTPEDNSNPISAVSWGANRIDVFYRGTGNTLRWLWWNGGPAWSGADGSPNNDSLGSPPGETLTSPPVAEASDRLNSGDIIVTARTTSGNVWGRRLYKAANGLWDPWVNYGSPPTVGGIDGSPVPFHKPRAGFYILARSTDGYLWYRDEVSTSVWKKLKDIRTVGQPSAVRCEGLIGNGEDSRIGIFVRDIGGSLKWMTFSVTPSLQEALSDWGSLGGIISASPSAAAIKIDGTNRRINVFVRDTNNGLQRRTWQGLCDGPFEPNVASWTPYENLGGVFSSNPAAVGVAGPNSNRHDAVVRGASNTVHDWSTTFNYAALSGSTIASPAVVSWGPNRVDIFTRTASSNIAHLAWTGGGFTDWYPAISAWEIHAGTIGTVQ